MSEFKIGFHHGKQGKLEIGRPFYIHPSVYIDNTGDIEIGNHVSISRNVEIYTHCHYHDRALNITQALKEKKVKVSSLEIGDDVYIGAKTVILAKVGKIGRGAVIGAGSIVTKPVGEYEVWGGNPATKIGDRV